MNEPRFQHFWVYNLDLHNLHIEKRVFTIGLIYLIQSFQLRIVANPGSKFRDELLLNVKLESLMLSDSQGAVGGAQGDEGCLPENVCVSHVEQASVPDVQKYSTPEAEAIYTCDVCSARYQKYGLLVNHLAKKHGVVQPTLLKCDNCDKCFDTVKKLNRHKKLSH